MRFGPWRLVASALVALSLVFTVAADAKIITLVRITSPVRVGQTVTLTVKVGLRPATCSGIADIRPSFARLLRRKKVFVVGQKLTWTWTAGKVPGRYIVKLRCAPRFREPDDGVWIGSLETGLSGSDLEFQTTYRVTK